MAVSGLSGVTAVAAGDGHSLALLSNGTVMAWGENLNGQLGDRTTQNSDVPVAVSGLSGVTAVAAGNEHSLALLSNGTVMAWGDDRSGQLGNGERFTTWSYPVPVSGLSGVTAIAGGYDDSLALLSNGTVMDWGTGGQLGDGSSEGSDVPVAVKGLSEVRSIATSGSTNFAVLDNGTVMAWGSDSSGQLGSGGEGAHDLPVAVNGLSEVTAVGGGDFASLALLANGTVVAWGEGALGDGKTTRSTTPVAVSGLSNVTAIGGGYGYLMALQSNGRVMAWGSNRHGELGDGTTTESTVPVQVSKISEATTIAPGQNFILAVGAPLFAVSSVEPHGGPTAGGTSVTITGSGFSGVSAVNFGSTSATEFTVNSENSITALSPPGTGTVNVTVTTPAGTSATSPSDQFTYGVSVAKVEPAYGPAGGGTQVTITGIDFTGATAVMFGSNAASSYKVESANRITAVSPAGTGVVNVTVTTAEGTSPAVAEDVFAYSPAVTKLTPNSGEESGETSVHITGTNFTGVSAVKFGSLAATSFKVESDTSIVAVSPAGKGVVNVTVTNAGGTSAASLANYFRYDGPSSCSPKESERPEITKVQPNQGPPAGGNSVTITGKDFLIAAPCEGSAAIGDYEVKNVLFGSTPSPHFVVDANADEEGTIVAVAPPGTGTVDITVEIETASKTSAVTPADRYSYAATAPSAVTEPASAITLTSATLNATVNPNGPEVTKCEFEYGTTNSYGKTAPCASRPGPGESPVAVSAAISGLSAGTTYHFRISATNSAGTSTGSDQELTTLLIAPTVETRAASSVTQTTATLNATVNPNASEVTTCEFEYGPPEAPHEKSVPCSSLPGDGDTAVPVGASITGLQANKTYHFRISATNAGGTNQGTDQTFQASRVQFGNDGQLGEPARTAVDSEGNVWVTEPAAGHVVELNAQGAYVNGFGSKGSGPGQLWQPYGIAIDPQGNVWVADSGNDRLEQFSKTGAYLQSVGSPGTGKGQLENPMGLAVDSKGDLWVTEYFALTHIDRVKEFTKNGEGKYEEHEAFGSEGSGSEQLKGPLDIAADNAGHVWVADTGNSRIVQFEESGKQLREITGIPAHGLGVDAEGNLWAADTATDEIKEFSSEGKALASFGSKGSGQGQFSSPQDVAVSPGKEVWVADTANDRMQELSEAGAFIREAGSPAREDQLSSPAGITTDAEGNVWVADFAHNRLAKFSPSGAYLAQIGKEGLGEGQLKSPLGLAMTSAGKLAVATDVYIGFGHIYLYSTAGKLEGEIGSYGTTEGHYRCPEGLAADKEGHVFIADYCSDHVDEFSESGTFIEQIGAEGSGNGQLKEPRWVAIDPTSGNLVVSDTANDRVEVFKKGVGGKYEYASSFGSKGTGNGQFEGPQGVGVDSKGNIWVADSGNHRVQQLKPKEGGGYEYTAQLGSPGSGEGQFSAMAGLTVDPSGNVWVSDAGNNRVAQRVT